MTHPAFPTGLIDRLPPVRGRMEANAPLHNGTWFRVGGPAEVLFQPADAEDLTAFLKACPTDVPVTVLGVGSNVIVRDGGLAGVVIRLGPRFGKITIEGDCVIAGAGALDFNIARTAMDASLAGLEFLSGIPGTLGGGLLMNAGAHGGELKDILIEATLILRDGSLCHLTPQELGMAYRKTATPEGAIFIEARLRGQPDAREAIEARMKHIAQTRAESQPIREKTGGSTFANPEGHKAWQLIDQAGCRGLRIGDAMMSEKHCNFMLNVGQATAEELETLGEDVRKRVRETSGVELRWEIKRIGLPLSKGEQA